MDDCGGYATMRERWEGVESPGAYVDDQVSRGRLCLAMCSFCPPSGGLSPGEGCDAVTCCGRGNCEKGATTEN